MIRTGVKSIYESSIIRWWVCRLCESRCTRLSIWNVIFSAHYLDKRRNTCTILLRVNARYCTIKLKLHPWIGIIVRRICFIYCFRSHHYRITNYPFITITNTTYTLYRVTVAKLLIIFSCQIWFRDVSMNIKISCFAF